MSINDQLIGVSVGGTISVFDILQSSPFFRNEEITTLMHITQCTMAYFLGAILAL